MAIAGEHVLPKLLSEYLKRKTENIKSPEEA